MALPVSSLSLALQGFADFLDSQFGEEVVTSLETPAKAAESAKAGDKAVLNVFVFRLAPSGFHADAGAQSPLFVRAHLLLTCFPPGQGDPEPDTDLRVIGHAMAVLHSIPVIPLVLPGAPPPGSDDLRSRDPVPYRMQAVLHAPQMEELNHIWTTQGGDLAYRLSAAYELALIPIEPLTRAEPAAPVVAAVLDVGVGATPPNGMAGWGGEARAFALGQDTWAPVVLFPLVAGFAQSQSLPPAATQTEIALAGGPTGARVAVRIDWQRADASTSTVSQGFTLAGQQIDQPSARFTLPLGPLAAGDRATISARAADAGGAALPGAPPGNVLTLTVGP